MYVQQAVLCESAMFVTPRPEKEQERYDPETDGASDKYSTVLCGKAKTQLGKLVEDTTATDVSRVFQSHPLRNS